MFDIILGCLAYVKGGSLNKGASGGRKGYFSAGSEGPRIGTAGFKVHSSQFALLGALLPWLNPWKPARDISFVNLPFFLKLRLQPWLFHIMDSSAKKLTKDNDV